MGGRVGRLDASACSIVHVCCLHARVRWGTTARSGARSQVSTATCLRAHVLGPAARTFALFMLPWIASLRLLAHLLLPSPLHHHTCSLLSNPTPVFAPASAYKHEGIARGNSGELGARRVRVLVRVCSLVRVRALEHARTTMRIRSLELSIPARSHSCVSARPNVCAHSRAPARTRARPPDPTRLPACARARLIPLLTRAVSHLLCSLTVVHALPFAPRARHLM